jgi:DNA-binding response OmpR family regulator
VLTAGTLPLDPARRVVEPVDTPITLTPREFGLVDFLMRNENAVVTKTEILQNAWDAHYTGPDSVVEVYVGCVPRKMAPAPARATNTTVAATSAERADMPQLHALRRRIGISPPFGGEDSRSLSACSFAG